MFSINMQMDKDFENILNKPQAAQALEDDGQDDFFTLVRAR